MNGRITPELITKLEPNQVFVFGSNLSGKHGKGAAKDALKWGAKWGKGVGLSGQTYGLPTKARSVYVTLPLNKIKEHVEDFIQVAKDNPELIFLVTKVGCNLAGYTPRDIAPLFKDAIEVENIHLPVEFWNKLKIK